MLCLAFEFMPSALQRELRLCPILECGEATRLFVDLFAGAAHLHKLNIIHADISPANIFLDKSRVGRLGDFGCVLQGPVSSVSQRTGTPEYRSPELHCFAMRPDITARADCWSLGYIFGSCVSGLRFFRIDMSDIGEDPHS